MAQRMTLSYTGRRDSTRCSAVVLAAGGVLAAGAAVASTPGDGGACDPAQIYAPARPTSIGSPATGGAAAGDLDNDGAADVVSANRNANSISILRGLGDGRFSAVQTVPLTPPDSGFFADVRDPVITDTNSDGWPDILVSYLAAGESGVAVLLNDGAGGFSGATGFATQPAPGIGGAAGVDLTGDGLLDLVQLVPDEDRFVLFAAIGDGTLVNAEDWGILGQPSGVVSADFDGDGGADLAVSLAQSGEVAVYLNTGAGGLGGAALFSAASPDAIASGDFNRDGLPDLATLSIAEKQVEVFLGNGSESFGAPSAVIDIAAQAGTIPVSLAAHDADGDGMDDLHVGLASGGVMLFVSADNGAFLAGERYGADREIASIAFADLDGDGAADLVGAGNPLARAVDAAVVVMRNDCIGITTCPADLTGDGVLDLSDISAFVSGFTGLDPVSDLDGNGVFDLSDITAFVGSFAAGCP